MLGGGIEAAVGYGFAAFTAASGVGVAAGIAVGLHGSDVATTGFYELLYGVPRDTLTSQGLQAIGLPQNDANGVDAGISMGVTMGMGAAVEVGLAAKSFNSIGNEVKAVPVSHWGSQEIHPGSYVVVGENTFINYLKSGKWQPGFGNEFAAPWTGFSTYVPASTLHSPSKAATATGVFDSPIMDPIKGWIFNQRSYWGPTVSNVP